MPFLMWTLFKKSLGKNLATVFGLDRVQSKSVMKKAKTKYREIIFKLPEFEKGDRFKMNIVNCAVGCAVVLCMPKRPTVEELTVYYRDSMMTSTMKWFCRMSGKRKFTKKDIDGMKKQPIFVPPTATPIRGIWTFCLTPTVAVTRLALQNAAFAF